MRDSIGLAIGGQEVFPPGYSARSYTGRVHLNSRPILAGMPCCAGLVKARPQMPSPP